MICFYFHSVLCNFCFLWIFSLIHGLFKVCFFGFWVFVELFIFFVLLTSSLIPFCSENTFCILSMILPLLKFVFWTRLWSFFVNVPWALEKMCVFCSFLGLGDCIEIKIIPYLRLQCSVLLSLSKILSVLSVAVSRVLKSLTIILNLYIYLFNSVFIFCVSELCCFIHSHLKLLCLLSLSLLLLFCDIPHCLIIFCIKVYFIS